MRKRSIYLWAVVASLMTMTACSDQKDDSQSNGEKADFKFEITFEDAVETRAPSKAIPTTSWNNIKQLQVMLYNASGEVCYSKIEDSFSGGTITCPDVPVGTGYTLVAIANAGGDNAGREIDNYIGTDKASWNAYNVRSKQASTLALQHTAGTFPTHADPSASNWDTPNPANKAYKNPSEIFKGTLSNIDIVSGETTIVPTPLKLTREVALMRVRLQINDADAGVNNGPGANGVDWNSNVAVLLYTLPNDINVINGVSASSTKTKIQVCTTAFKTTDPASGYAPTEIIDTDFVMWDDIIVFPNNKGAALGNATVGQKYSIVVSALGKAGHKLANNTTLANDQTIYWEGLISEPFSPNKIREVNLTLKSGGSTELPTSPSEKGNMTITVSAPEPWNGNIEITEKEL